MEATLKEQGEKEALDKLANHRRDNRKPFFLWKLQFLEVFQDKGGFDIMIANPPYVPTTPRVEDRSREGSA